MSERKELLEKVEIIKNAMDNKQAEQIELIDISEKSSVADYFVICSGNSLPQVKSIAEEIDYQMSLKGNEYLSIEGKQSSKWILMDYGDVIAHIFLKDQREYYNLERLWNNNTKEI